MSGNPSMLVCDNQSKSGNKNNVGIRLGCGQSAVVERTHQRPMVRLFRRMDGMDAGCVRLHRLPAHHGADRAGVWRSDHRSDRGLLGHPGHAARWCDSLRLVGRPFGTPGTADDFDPVVFGVQFACRALADLHLPVRDPGAAGHRDGGGVASRRGAGDGILAGPLTWTDVRSVAGIVGAGLCLVRRWRTASCTLRSKPGIRAMAGAVCLS